jgi:predicted dehydrogenase
MTEPLRIGILGAARISDLSIIEPAHQLGHRLVAVAARNRQRAELYAAENDIERVHDSYGEVINDPEVEVVYNPLPNSLHAPWNAAAIRAGKHVLSEKPFASNADEASYVHALAASTSQVVFEAFHYRYHPIFERLLEISNDGTIGELTHFHVTMSMPAPAPDDLRWSWSLSGGCLMDLGCYCVHVIRTLAASRDATVSLAAAEAGQRADLPRMDEWCNATFRLSDGQLGRPMPITDADSDHPPHGRTAEALEITIARRKGVQHDLRLASGQGRSGEWRHPRAGRRHRPQGRD